MAVIRDMIPEFDLFQPTDVTGALDLLDRFRDRAWILAGGLDSMDWFKDRIKRPEAVVDLGAIDELRGIRASGDQLEIGALTTLTEVARSEEVRSQYRILAEAAALVATPQIRNQGTIGGNISQDTRCWYYRGGWPCYRAGGNICYADTPTSMNREHCLFGANRCVAVNPSDVAPALIALDAQMVVRSRSGEDVIPADDFFIGPSIDITRMTQLQPTDLLVAIRIPKTFANAHSYFEKVHDRESWDFPLVNVASTLRLNGDTIEDARVVVGAVAPFPYRLTRAENVLRGQTRNAEIATAAGEQAVVGARPLRHNSFKIPMMRNLVRRAVRDARA